MHAEDFSVGDSTPADSQNCVSVYCKKPASSRRSELEEDLLEVMEEVDKRCHKLRQTTDIHKVGAYFGITTQCIYFNKGLTKLLPLISFICFHVALTSLQYASFSHPW